MTTWELQWRIKNVIAICSALLIWAQYLYTNKREEREEYIKTL